MSYCCFVMIGIKCLALVIVIIAGVISMLGHWRTLFKPNLKQIKERRLKAVEEVYSLITDYRFLPLYFLEKDVDVPVADLKKLLNKKADRIISLYLPEHIRESLKDFSCNLVDLFSLKKNDKNYTEKLKKGKETFIKINGKICSEIIDWFKSQ